MVAVCPPVVACVGDKLGANIGDTLPTTVEGKVQSTLCPTGTGLGHVGVSLISETNRVDVWGKFALLKLDVLSAWVKITVRQITVNVLQNGARAVEATVAYKGRVTQGADIVTQTRVAFR